jgi:ketosteroid isomerase-like protein
MKAPHLTTQELEAGLNVIRQSPKDGGVVRLIVRRPRTEEREVLQEATLDVEEGLVGDNWKARGSGFMPDRSAHPDMQLNIMGSRAIALVAREEERWPLAGDQLFIDLDLSADNLPPGTRLALGSAVIEVTPVPHTGCKKFVARFGADAMKFVNSPVGRQLNLRGINARVVQPGKVRVGDVVRKTTNTDDTMQAARIVERFREAWAKPDVERFMELLHPEVCLFQPVTPAVVGIDAARREFRRLLAWLPDLQGTVDSWGIGEDGQILIAWRLRFTLGRGPFELRIVDRIVALDGMIREREAYFDSLGFMLATLRRPSAWTGFLRYRGLLPGW